MYIGDQGNTNQDHREFLVCTHSNYKIFKNLKISSIDEDANAKDFLIHMNRNIN